MCQIFFISFLPSVSFPTTIGNPQFVCHCRLEFESTPVDPRIKPEDDEGFAGWVPTHRKLGNI